VEVVSFSKIIPVIAPIAFLGAVILFALMSAFLNFHWSRYEIRPERAAMVRTIYFVGGGLLLLLMALILVLYLL
jgi:hypothetical protein